MTEENYFLILNKIILVYHRIVSRCILKNYD